MPRIPRHLRRIDASQFRREEASDSDESDGESSAVGIIDAAVSHVRCEVSSPPRKKNKKHMNEDGEEWKTSKQKGDIIAAFLVNESGIQSMSPAQIFDAYADGVGWEKQNTMANIRRLMKQYTNKEGPFSEKEMNKAATPEPFKTKTTQSKAYTLLLQLYMKSSQSGIDKKSDEEIYQSDPIFSQYPLSDFKKYIQKVQKVSKKRKKKLSRDTDTFRRQMESNPRGDVTDRGLPFWDTHPGYEMLLSDFDKIEKGEMGRPAPMDLYKTRNVYQEFPFPVFKYHFNQEKRKRREANFWRHKMKLDARKAHVDEVEKMYDEWLWSEIDGDELAKSFSKSLRLSDEDEEENEQAK